MYQCISSGVPSAVNVLENRGSKPGKPVILLRTMQIKRIPMVLRVPPDKQIFAQSSGSLYVGGVDC